MNYSLIKRQINKYIIQLIKEHATRKVLVFNCKIDITLHVSSNYLCKFEVQLDDNHKCGFNDTDDMCKMIYQNYTQNNLNICQIFGKINILEDNKVILELDSLSFNKTMNPRMDIIINNKSELSKYINAEVIGTNYYQGDDKEIMIQLKCKNKVRVGNFIFRSLHEVQCRNKHIFLRQNSVSNLRDCTCWICDQNIKDIAIFKLLDELKCNYYIKEESPIKGSTVKSNTAVKGVYGKKLKRLTIITYNDAKHLTGKIVLDDSFGEHQARCKAQNIHFRWAEISKIDDIEYCKELLYEYFDEINTKFNLK